MALHARLQPGSLAIQDLGSGQSWSYQAFDRIVSQYATLLRLHRLEKSARVAVLARNRADLVFLHLACARIGAIYVPLNWRLSAVEIKALLQDSRPSLLLGDAALAEANLNGLSLDEFASAARQTNPADHECIDVTAPSVILYTSGTSGRPKGVLLSESNIWQTALNFSIVGRITHESVVLCDAPMFHIIGLITNIRPSLMRGGRIVVSEGFLASRTLARLADGALGVTHYFCVPQMASALRADPMFDPSRLRHLTAIFSGGAPHAPEAIRAWTKDGIPMADGFGMSEAGTVSCMPVDLELIDAHAGSAGIVPPGITVKIVDEQGKECAAECAGEILLQGRSVTKGYWALPQESKAAFDAEGWLHTGDIGKIDRDAFLWVIDRKKDMYISGSENVYPAEIELALADYPHISECAVIGVPDERWGEAGHLFVVSLNAALDLLELKAFLDSRLARYKVPQTISIIGKLPRNAAGKILKSELRRLFS